MTVGKQNLLVRKGRKGCFSGGKKYGKCLGIIFYEIEKQCNSFFTGSPWDSDESDGSVFTSAGI